jgi:hypothetical protein
MRFVKQDQEMLAEAYSEIVEESFRNKLLGGLALAGLAAGGYKAASGNNEPVNTQPGLSQSNNQEYKIGSSLVTVVKSDKSTLIQVKTAISKVLGPAKGTIDAKAKNKQAAETIANKLGFSSPNISLDGENIKDTNDYILRYYKIDPSAKKLTISGDTEASPKQSSRTTVVSPDFND